jgi:phosphohistidine phosphatase
VSPRTLWILRHAKTREAPPAGQGDRARELKPRGRRAARAIGQLLARVEDPPVLVLASDAVRARETAELALESGELACELVLEPAIYEASAETLLDVLRRAPKKSASVLLVGHQPGLGALLGLLLGHEPELPPGAIVRLEFEGGWTELAPRSAKLTLLLSPDVLLADDEPRD